MTAGDQGLGKRIGVAAYPRLIGAEGLRARDLEARGLGGDCVAKRTTLETGKDGAIHCNRVLLRAEDEATARSRQRLVRRRRDEVAERGGIRVETSGDEPGEVRHVAQQKGSHLVRDLAEPRGIDLSRIRR